MKTQNTSKSLLDLSHEEALKQKKKIATHCINLECQKEQLQILIEKLNKISNERVGFQDNTQGHNIISMYLDNVGSYFSSIGNQLKKAQKNRQQIETEICEAKKQVKFLDSILMKKQG